MKYSIKYFNRKKINQKNVSVFLIKILRRESGIRTHGTIPSSSDFKSDAIDHSAISPKITSFKIKECELRFILIQARNKF